MELPITLHLRPSVSLAAVLFMGHGLAIVAVLPCALPFVGKGLLILLLGLSCLYSLARHAFHRGGPASLTLHRKGGLALSWADGKSSEPEVDPATTVHLWLIVLRLRSRRGRRTLLLTPDTLGTDAHRRLRLWLRWQTEEPKT